MKQSRFITLFLCCGLLACKPATNNENVSGNKQITVASYYFPDYHPDDERMNALRGEGWSEWELMKQAKPRFEGHQQPKVPLWGYTDESDPEVMAMKIDAAADHDIDAFIFDWYWDNEGIYWEKGLEGGFMEAMQATKERLEMSSGPMILNINCWNEWTEGSYLEPDTINGMAYLETLKKVMVADK